jgi:Fe2+ transport system protein FeoA
VWKSGAFHLFGWRQPLAAITLTYWHKRLFCQAVTPVKPDAGLIRLNELPPRVCAVVRSIETDDEESLRLKTLGVCVGRRVELVRKGDPLVLKVFGSRLGISSSLASRVQVEVCEPGHCALHENEGA